MKGLATLSLRVRLMIIGVIGVAVALCLGGLLLYAALVVSVNRTLDNEARAGAEEVAAMVEQDRLPAPIPVSGAQVVQVVDAEGRVVGGSATADRLVPLLNDEELDRALAGEPVIVGGSRAGVSGPLRVSAVAAGPAGDPVSVIVGVQFGDVVATRVALRNAMLISFPILLVVLALIAWRVIGQTLRPVEELRLGAERIGAADEAAERLPVPAAADEIRSLALTLNSMLDRLASARSRQRSFVADAAHELRSPLASMRTQLEVAQHLGEAGELPADLLVEVQRLGALVDDLLMLARLDADRPRPATLELFEVHDLLADVAASYPGARVRVEWDGGSPEPAEVSADRAELRRALANLVDNAVRHAGSEVRLGASVEPGAVLLTVADDGPGIPLDQRERVFDRFARLDDARSRDAGGTGLGLAIVRGLVGRAGGTVGFGSDPRLSVATIRLPAQPT